MKRLVRSQGYARARVVIGAVAALLGAILIVRTFLIAGLTWAALPAYVLGLALILLGFVRAFEYRAWSRMR